MRRIIGLVWLWGLLFFSQSSTVKPRRAACGSTAEPLVNPMEKPMVKPMVKPMSRRGCYSPVDGFGGYVEDSKENLTQANNQTEQQRLSETMLLLLTSNQTKGELAIERNRGVRQSWHPFGRRGSSFAPQAENKEKTNQTEDQRLNDTAVIFEVNQSEAEQSTQSPKTRAKRTTTDTYQDWHFFGSGPGSRFAPQSEEEQRNTTADPVLNVTEIFNETMSEQTTPLPTTTTTATTTAKLETTTDFVWHPFRSPGGARFAPHSEDNNV